MREMDARVWLFDHGFTVASNETHFKTDAVDRTIHVRISNGIGRTTVSRQKRATTLREFDVADLRLDEHGMLHGAGLDHYFIDLMAKGFSAPHWFPEEYEDEARRIISSPNWDRNVRCMNDILAWGEHKGFRRVAHRTLRGVYRTSRTDFEIGMDSLTFRVMDRDGNFTVTEAGFEECGYEVRLMRKKLRDEPGIAEKGPGSRRR